MTEFDLPARLNKTIRKNLQNSTYEIVDISSKEVAYSRQTLSEVVQLANKLGDRITIKCDFTCPATSLRQPIGRNKVIQ